MLTASLLMGCTMTQKRNAFVTLKVVAQTVDSSRKAYAEAKVSRRISIEKTIEIDNAVTKYQVSMNAAISAARFNWEAPAPEQVQNLATLVTVLINTFTR